MLSGVNVPFAGKYDLDNNGGGQTNIKRFDVSPDGSRLVAVGNFSSVGGQTRSQVAVLDTSGAATSVAPWFTDRYDRPHNSCAGVFDTFARDVDFSPDGSYFVVSATGAFAGGAGSGTCATPSPAGRSPAPATTPRGPTTPEATRRTASP